MNQNDATYIEYISPLWSSNIFLSSHSVRLILFCVIWLLDDEHWVIDTDYYNYAIQYSCRLTDADGTCADSYSFIFSRYPGGLRPEDQNVVTRKKDEICLLGKYRRVAHTGEWCQANCSFVCPMINWSAPLVSQRLSKRPSEWLMKLSGTPHHPCPTWLIRWTLIRSKKHNKKNKNKAKQMIFLLSSAGFCQNSESLNLPLDQQ